MLILRCLRQVMSELQPSKDTGKYMGGMQKMAKFISE